MSSEEEAAVAVEDICCANCGVSAIDDIKLKDCDNCDLVKYCSDVCQNNHRDQHDEECKQRAAEIRDIDLFTQPDESHLGECPICCLPLPIDASKSTFMDCCSKIICDGCNVANKKREIEAGLEERCAFCRETTPRSQQEAFKRIMKRAKKNDPAALYHMGKKCRNEGDNNETALKYLTMAAELGDASAHYSLSVMYLKGQGVEKDDKKEVYHLEKAAIGGHPEARHNLGCEEADNGRYERAEKYFIIAANLGNHDSLYNLKILYTEGHMTAPHLLLL